MADLRFKICPIMGTASTDYPQYCLNESCVFYRNEDCVMAKAFEKQIQTLTDISDLEIEVPDIFKEAT